MEQPNKETSPGTTKGEAWYDTEIAPVLNELANRCRERGMSFVAAVEYQPGDHAGVYSLTPGAHPKMHMLQLCSMTAPNVDGYIIALRRYCAAEGIDTGGSFALRGIGA